ncbi:MAG: DUF4105 domain-containing protein [Proteobacteria bacterium]|nr:DUF4105 domain-containing protein [Pseudomonadota bacterium]
MKRLILMGWLVLLLSPLSARPVRADDGAPGRHTIHLLTFGRGEDLFSRFGHIALVVDDHHKGTRLIYNFGTFDFSDPALQFKYARGFLNYWLSVDAFQPMVDFYRYLDRDIWMHTLNFTNAEADQVAERLRINARPENRVYAYRHYLDNCCTRIRDIIDDTAQGALRRHTDTEPTGRTFRDWTRQSLSGLPVFQRIILYSLGPAIDHPLTRWQEAFLPEVLMADVAGLSLPDGRPLVRRETRLHRRQGPPIGVVVPTVDKIVLGALGLLLALGLLVPLLAPRWRPSRRLLGLGMSVWGLFVGLSGLMLVLYWTVTTHYDTHYNENLLLSPATHLWLLVPGMRLLRNRPLAPRTTRWLRGYLVFSLGLCALDLLLKAGPFIQFNYDILVLSALGNALLLAALLRHTAPAPSPEPTPKNNAKK